MRCKFCRARLLAAEHLPTDEGGEYTFECGTVLDSEEGEWLRSRECRQKETDR